MKSEKLWMVLVAAFLAGSARADIFMPTSYDMPNGEGVASGGAANYWDLEYSGSGNTSVDGSPLSGGLGNLTDGAVASANWNIVENFAGTGPYVGWRNIEPLISFHFASTIDFSFVSIHFDDADDFGGVSAPLEVIVNGLVFPVANPVGTTPFWIALDISSLGATNQLRVELKRRTQWIMASEFAFRGAAVVPEPTSGSILAMLGSLIWFSPRRRYRST